MSHTSNSAMGDDNTLLFSQEMLEQNEDIIAAVVENMQLGRMEDCIQHYSVLHKNIISLALALDNFPAGEHSRLPYHDLNKFPDEIMRKDILDELRPLGQTKMPQAPLIPACVECNQKKLTTHKCRTELGHIEPSGAFSSSEAQEFLKVAQLMQFRGETKKEEPVKIKRVYKVWSPSERFTVLLGLSRHGMKGVNLLKILKMLPDRNEGQLRSYISKNISEEDIAKAMVGVLPPEPDDYIFPPGYGYGYGYEPGGGGGGGEGRDGGREGQQQFLSECDKERGREEEDRERGEGEDQLAWQRASSAGQGASRLEPGGRHGTGLDWTALLGIVDGQGGMHMAPPVYSAGVASVGPSALSTMPLPSISASGLPPHFHPQQQQQLLLQHQLLLQQQQQQQHQVQVQQQHPNAAQISTGDGVPAPKKRKYTMKHRTAAVTDSSSSGVAAVPISKKVGKKRGKYKKRDKSKGDVSVAGTVTTNTPGCNGGSSSGSSSSRSSGSSSASSDLLMPHGVVSQPVYVQAPVPVQVLATASGGSALPSSPVTASSRFNVSTSAALKSGAGNNKNKDNSDKEMDHTHPHTHGHTRAISDENSMYLTELPLFASPQSHAHNRLLHSEDSKPPEIIFDGFSQFSFDWENSRSPSHSRAGGTPDRSNNNGNSSVSTPTADSRSNMLSLLADTAGSGGRQRGAGGGEAATSTSRGSNNAFHHNKPSNSASAGDENDTATGFDHDDVGEFSNLINPGDEFSLSIAK